MPTPCTRLVSRPEMAEFAALRASNTSLQHANTTLTEELAALRAAALPLGPYARGELAALRDSHAALLAANISLQADLATLTDRVDALGGMPLLEQVDALRSALVDANARAMAMDREMLGLEGEIAVLRGEAGAMKGILGKYRTGMGEMVRARVAAGTGVTGSERGEPRNVTNTAAAITTSAITAPTTAPVPKRGAARPKVRFQTPPRAHKPPPKPQQPAVRDSIALAKERNPKSAITPGADTSGTRPHTTTRLRSPPAPSPSPSSPPSPSTAPSPASPPSPSPPPSPRSDADRPIIRKPASSIPPPRLAPTVLAAIPTNRFAALPPASPDSPFITTRTRGVLADKGGPNKPAGKSSGGANRPITNGNNPISGKENKPLTNKETKVPIIRRSGSSSLAVPHRAPSPPSPSPTARPPRIVKNTSGPATPPATANPTSGPAPNGTPSPTQARPLPPLEPGDSIFDWDDRTERGTDAGATPRARTSRSSGQRLSADTTSAGGTGGIGVAI